MARLRAAGTDLQSIEVKKAAAGPPRELPETISAFANGGGGLVVLGLDESAGFAPLPIDAQRIADALATACADGVEPPVLAHIDVVEIEGSRVVAAQIPEAESALKPCFVKTQGLQRGSYLRTHDGDRHLTAYEVHMLVSSRGRPRDDMTLVDGAGSADLDPDLVRALLKRLRATRGPVFAQSDDDAVLQMVGVLRKGQDGQIGITLAGLMALGRYPQQYFPQLNTTIVVYPTVDGSPMADGTRFLDNVVADGAVPLQIDQALAALQRNMKRRALIVGSGREDRWEYPPEALRELLANALMHRDYHPLAHGTQVRVELFPDRLVVTSPGGLYGPVSTEDLLTDRMSSSRNAVLAKLLEDVEIPGIGRTVCENRGSGLLAVSSVLRRAGLRPPGLTSTLRSFTAEVSNQPTHDAVRSAPPTQGERILALLASGPATTAELAEALGISVQGVMRHLRPLRVAGSVTSTQENLRSPHNAWRLATP